MNEYHRRDGIYAASATFWIHFPPRQPHKAHPQRFYALGSNQARTIYAETSIYSATSIG